MLLQCDFQYVRQHRYKSDRGSTRSPKRDDEHPINRHSEHGVSLFPSRAGSVTGRNLSSCHDLSETICMNTATPHVKRPAHDKHATRSTGADNSVMAKEEEEWQEKRHAFSLTNGDWLLTKLIKLELKGFENHPSTHGAFLIRSSSKDPPECRVDARENTSAPAVVQEMDSTDKFPRSRF